jgi:hypothetical protein
LTGKRNLHDTIGLDRWDFFWSEYIVFALRFACYAANEFFFFSVRTFLDDIVPAPFTVMAILAYSVVTLMIIEKLFAQNYNPAYPTLNLSTEERQYRISRERIIYSCLTYSAVNAVLGIICAVFLGQHNDIELSIFAGISGVLLSFFGVFVGTICMVGRSQESGKRMPYLYPVGLAGHLVPAVFVFLTVKRFIFASATSW